MRYQRNEQNLGVTGNFNKCLELATCDYMVMMGSDDVMLPGYVAHDPRIGKEIPGVGIIQPGVRGHRRRGRGS